MAYSIDYINTICTDLGGSGGHEYEIDGLNEICTLLSATAGHTYSIDALNAICTALGYTAGWTYDIDALNTIVVGGNYQYEYEAWSDIQLGSKLNLLPFYSDALVFLDGSITTVGSDKYFVDKKNGKNFLITGYDFTDALHGFPYKSAATISAPAADAALIAADINNYLYAADGTPNAIPVIALYQDVDYEHKLFCRHVAQVVDGNGVETSEPYVAEIVLYTTVKSGDDLTDCQTYYGVPTEDATAYWVDPINGSDTAPGDGSKAHPWKTLVTAVSTVIDGKNIYLKSGVVLASGYLNDTRDHNVIGLGLVITTPDGATNGLAISKYSEVFNGIYSKPTVDATRHLYPNASALNLVLSKMYLLSSGSGGMMSGTLKELKNSIFKGAFSNGIVFSAFPDNTDIDTNLINIALSAGNSLVVGANVVCNIKNNKIIISGVGSISSAVGATGVTNYIGNYIESAGTPMVIRNDGDINVKWNTIKAPLNITWNNDTKTTVILGNCFFNVKCDLDCEGTIENNVIQNTSNIDGFGFILTAANAIRSAIIRNNTLVTSATGSFIIGSDSSNSANNKVVISLFEKNKIIASSAIHGVLMGYQPNPIARYNWIEVGEGYGFVMENVDGMTAYNSGGIYYNVCKNDFRSVVGNPDGLRIYNNTFISTSTEPISLIGSQGHPTANINTLIKNNIFISLAGEDTTFIVFGSATQEVDYNLYYCDSGVPKFKIGATVYTFAEWQALGFDTHSVVLTTEQFNGLFTDFANDDYSLKAGSLAIGSGVDLGTDYDDGLDASTDWGDTNDLAVVVTKQQGAAWDCGAYVH